MPVDFSFLVGEVSMSDAVTALVVLGGIKVVPNAVKWAVNQLSEIWR